MDALFKEASAQDSNDYQPFYNKDQFPEEIPADPWQHFNKNVLDKAWFEKFLSTISNHRPVPVHVTFDYVKNVLNENRTLSLVWARIKQIFRDRLPGHLHGTETLRAWKDCLYINLPQHLICWLATGLIRGATVEEEIRVTTGNWRQP